jgi:hypothetical protein
MKIGFASLLLTGFFASSCGSDPMPVSAEQTVHYAARNLAKSHNPGVIWDLLPERYQADINTWCRHLAKALPKDAYEKIFAVAHKTGAVLKQKSDFLAANLPLKMMLQMFGNASEDDLAATFAGAGDVFLLLARSDIATIEGLGSLDAGQFFHDTGARIGRSAIRAFRILGTDPIAELQAAQIEVLGSTPTSTTLRIRSYGQQFDLPFVQVDHRWVPAIMDSTWQEMSPIILREIAALDLKSSSQLLWLLGQISADLDKLLEIESRSKFEKTIMDLVGKYQKLQLPPR